MSAISTTGARIDRWDNGRPAHREHARLVEALKLERSSRYLYWAAFATENDLHIISGKVAADHVHMFLSYRAHQNISQIVQWLKGTSSRVLFQEFPHLKKQYWGRHLWARGYFAVTSGNITDEMINEYINEQEGEPVGDDSRFQIDPS